MNLVRRKEEDPTLHLQLDVDLEHVPISGRLRGERGEDEPFIGWLGFVVALQRLRERIATRRSDAVSIETHPQQAPDSIASPSPILVIGATGKTGRRIAERLTGLGLDVRHGSRSARPAFDWADQSTWAPALEGVSKAYISYYPDLAAPGAPEAVGALAEVAGEQGVQHVVLLSGRGEEEAQAAEAEVQRSGVPWTIVRCSWFCQNFSEAYLLDPILAGEVALPAGDVPEPFVDVDDIAEVAVAALTEDGHEGRLYELTGSRMLTFAEAVGEIAATVGREIAFIPITFEEYGGALAQYDIPEDVIGLLRYLFTEVLDGRNAHVANGVQDALGRPARDFGDFVRRTAATGVWNV
jgi:uncharacterized protein YbjT (DUF2867 family)